jgi:hypothetical protein
MGDKPSFPLAEVLREIVADAKDPTPRILYFAARCKKSIEAQKRFLDEIVGLLWHQSQGDQITKKGRTNLIVQRNNLVATIELSFCLVGENAQNVTREKTGTRWLCCGWCEICGSVCTTTSRNQQELA